MALGLPTFPSYRIKQQSEALSVSTRGGPLSAVRSASSALFPFLCFTPQFSLFKKERICPKTLNSVLSSKHLISWLHLLLRCWLCSALQLEDICVATGMTRWKHKDAPGTKCHRHTSRGLCQPHLAMQLTCCTEMKKDKSSQGSKEVKKMLVITKHSIKAGERAADFTHRCAKPGHQSKSQSY